MSELTEAGAPADRALRCLANPDLVRLEGVHAVKHALRFAAAFAGIFTSDISKATLLLSDLAPDILTNFASIASEVDPALMRELSREPVHTDVVGFAKRPRMSISEVLPTPDRPSVLLDDPRHLGNVGAAIRAAAAAGCKGLLLRGDVDPFAPLVTRGAAGLQFALPVVTVRALDDLRDTQVFAFDADGEVFDPAETKGSVVFAFGSERSGLSDEVRERADRIVALPMRAGVSSLNLATSVAAALYLRHYALLPPREVINVAPDTRRARG